MSQEIYDGAWRLFKHDAATGRTVWVIHDDGKMHFRIDYPVENLIRENAEKRAAAEGTKRGELSHIASVPLNVYHASGLAEASGQQDDKFIARFLNDPDNAAWRTRKGRV